MIDSKKIVNSYLSQQDWKVKENSNAPFSFGALNKQLSGAVSEDYWLNEVYTDTIAEAHRSGYMHLHDLGGLTLYCCGYSLQAVIMKGVVGIPNIPRSGPAKHFASILNQLANLTTIYQNEIMGAVAFSSFDTLLAPFVREDKLSYDEVRQHLQNYIFSVNSNSRAGAEPAFSNITIDINPPKDLKDQYAIVGAELMDYTYGDLQEEMDMINTAFCELMAEGDCEGKPFAYPIPTCNIHEFFDWNSPVADKIFELSGKSGAFYFANFINSDMDVSDVRSMCCRLQLDKRELRKRGGGLFGADDYTGSIGVVTLNLPRMAHLSKTKEDFYIFLRHYMELACESLEIKRAFLEDEVLARNALPAFSEYVGHMNNHFSTIGLVGMNEMCLNAVWLGKDIIDEESIIFCEDVLNYMRDTLKEFQDITGNLYNLEATPAESTCYRLALKDKIYFPNIITQGEGNSVYYTNSCRVPVHLVDSVETALTVADRLQPLFTGGSAEHLYLGTSISGSKAKKLVYAITHEYKVPYISISPVTAFCPEHGQQIFPGVRGQLKLEEFKCPKCGKQMKLFQRITGYTRNVDNYNNGKLREFLDRNQL